MNVMNNTQYVPIDEKTPEFDPVTYIPLNNIRFVDRIKAPLFTKDKFLYYDVNYLRSLFKNGALIDNLGDIKNLNHLLPRLFHRSLLSDEEKEINYSEINIEFKQKLFEQFLKFNYLVDKETFDNMTVDLKEMTELKEMTDVQNINIKIIESYKYHCLMGNMFHIGIYEFISNGYVHDIDIDNTQPVLNGKPIGSWLIRRSSVGIDDNKTNDNKVTIFTISYVADTSYINSIRYMLFHDVGIYLLLGPSGYNKDKLPINKYYFDKKDFTVKSLSNELTKENISSVPKYGYLMEELFHLHYLNMISLPLIVKNDK